MLGNGGAEELQCSFFSFLLHVNNVPGSAAEFPLLLQAKRCHKLAQERRGEREGRGGGGKRRRGGEKRIEEDEEDDIVRRHNRIRNENRKKDFNFGWGNKTGRFELRCLEKFAPQRIMVGRIGGKNEPCEEGSLANLHWREPRHGAFELMRNSNYSETCVIGRSHRQGKTPFVASSKACL